MDNQCFMTLSKFTVEARKVIGMVNPAKLVKDSAYCEAIFQKVDASDNAELILLGLELRNQLGMLEPESAKTTAADETSEKSQLPSGKYMFGARG
jgi:hypothetical protein